MAHGALFIYPFKLFILTKTTKIIGTILTLEGGFAAHQTAPFTYIALRQHTILI